MQLDLPVYGMNCGTIGFLMNEYSLDGLPERVAAAEEEVINPLFMRATRQDGSTREGLAINEVSLLRQGPQAAKLRITVDGKVRMEELVCDGALVSTPAGSTAYNYSAHGPILPIGSSVLALTAMAAFRPRRWRGALLPKTRAGALRRPRFREAPGDGRRRRQVGARCGDGRDPERARRAPPPPLRPRPRARGAADARAVRLMPRPRFSSSAALLEIAGCFAVWMWSRLDRSVLWLAPGLLALAAFAFLLAQADSAFAGRAYAAYGGVYVAASLAWLWAVEGQRPDAFDLGGGGHGAAGGRGHSLRAAARLVSARSEGALPPRAPGIFGGR